MYTILINDDNSLYGSEKQTIMQRSSLVDKLRFIVHPIYKDIDMTDATVMLEYLLPVSHEYRTAFLILSEERYKDCYLQYVLPFNSALTREAGSIELQVTFVKTELDVNGKGIQRVRKTSTTTINIIPVAAWSDIIPDSALSSLDERLIKIDAQMRGLNDLANVLDNSKADNIKYSEDTNELQLLSNGNEIGNKVKLKSGVESLEDGVPIIDLNSASSIPPNPSDEDDEDNVVEF